MTDLYRIRFKHGPPRVIEADRFEICHSGGLKFYILEDDPYCFQKVDKIILILASGHWKSFERIKDDTHMDTK